mgnify:CR=1 FL=1
MSAKAFFEGSGFEGEGAAAERSVKIENAKYQELKKELDAAKTACLISANRRCLLAAPLNRRCLHAAPLTYILYKIEMKKFTDARACLNVLKIRMKLKAAEKPEWKIFEQQLQTIVDEQNKFLETLIAVCDLLDPVEAWWVPK